MLSISFPWWNNVELATELADQIWPYFYLFSFIAAILLCIRRVRFAGAYLGIVVAIIAFGGGVVSQRSAELQRLEAVKQRKAAEDADASIASLKQQLSTEVAERENLKDELKAAKSAATQMEQKLEEAQSRLDDTEAAASSNKSELDSHKEYGAVAQWTFDGSAVPRGGAGVAFGSPVAGWARNHITFVNDRPRCNCTDDDIEHFKLYINRFPKYPFPYYVLAVCLVQRQDSGWVAYAEKCLAIVEKTTQIDGHSPDHNLLKANVIHLLEHGGR
ncbi:MAG: hypothetical protein HF981_01555 [Desulfobacteraceae bacterium]|nr:hypothetical protein [Desulfobacteraceae bacterium]MBC2749047.1 hypothetical protein [Desulfobacteraceae bacterium]